MKTSIMKIDYLLLLTLAKVLTINGHVIRNSVMKYDPKSFASGRTVAAVQKDSNLKVISKEPFIISWEFPQGQENEDVEAKKSKRKPLKKKTRRKRDLPNPDEQKERSKRCHRSREHIRSALEQSQLRRQNLREMYKARKSQEPERVKSAAAPESVQLEKTEEPSQGSPIDHEEQDQSEYPDINEAASDNAVLENGGYQVKQPTPFSLWSDEEHEYELIPEHRPTHIDEYNEDDDPFSGRRHVGEKIKFLDDVLKSEKEKFHKENELIEDILNEVIEENKRIKRSIELLPNKLKSLIIEHPPIRNVSNELKVSKRSSDDGRESPKKNSSLNQERYKAKKWIDDMRSRRKRSKCDCPNLRAEYNQCVQCASCAGMCRQASRLGSRGEFKSDVDFEEDFDSLDADEYDDSIQEYGTEHRDSDSGLKEVDGKKYSEWRNFRTPKLEKGKNAKSPIKVPAEDKLLRVSKNAPDAETLIDNLQTYRDRAKQILRNAEEILKMIEEAEKKNQAESIMALQHNYDFGSDLKMFPELQQQPVTVNAGPRNGNFADAIKILKEVQLPRKPQDDHIVESWDSDDGINGVTEVLEEVRSLSTDAPVNENIKIILKSTSAEDKTADRGLNSKKLLELRRKKQPRKQIPRTGEETKLETVPTADPGSKLDELNTTAADIQNVSNGSIDARKKRPTLVAEALSRLLSERTTKAPRPVKALKLPKERKTPKHGINLKMNQTPLQVENTPEPLPEISTKAPVLKAKELQKNSEPSTLQAGVVPQIFASQSSPKKLENEAKEVSTAPTSESIKNNEDVDTTNSNLQAIKDDQNSPQIDKFLDDFEKGKLDDKDTKTIQNLDDKSIDHIIDEINEAEKAEVKNVGNCDQKPAKSAAECECSKEDSEDKYEILKGFLLWVKDMHLNRVLTN